jgi:AcrR family transcriptional regulator
MAKRRDRTEVVSTAAFLADRDGLAELSLSSVAAELGLHVSSLYNHVDGLDGLRHAVATRTLEELGQELWRAALGRSGLDAVEALARAYRGYIMEHPDRIKIVMLGSYSSPEYDAALAHIAAAIEAIMQSVGYEGPDAIHAHRLFSSMIVGFAMMFDLAASKLSGPPASDTFELLIKQMRSAFGERLTQVPL